MGERRQSGGPGPGIGLLAAQAHHMERIERALEREFSAQEPVVEEVAGHILRSGGKRIRPLLTVICGKMCGGEEPPLYRLSAVPEYLHAASLLHDDVVDEGELRRGRPPAYKIWGNKRTILVGDYLYAKAIHLAASFGLASIASTIAETVAYMAEGEILQLQYAQGPRYDQELYFRVIFRKTAVLIGAACKVGGLLAGAAGSMASALWEYGTNLGMAFQIVDDLLDLTADEAELGKAVGTDIADGKRTLPLLLALERAPDPEAHWLRSLLEAGRLPSPEEMARVRALLQETRALEDAGVRAREFGAAAVDALVVAQPGPEKRFLEELVEFVLTRRR